MDKDSNTPQTQDPFPRTAAAKTSSLHQLGKGTLIGLTIFFVILIVVIATISGQVSNAPIATPTAPAAAISEREVDTAATAFATQGTSDDIADIEADLNATNLDSLEDINKI